MRPMARRGSAWDGNKKLRCTEDYRKIWVAEPCKQPTIVGIAGGRRGIQGMLDDMLDSHNMEAWVAFFQHMHYNGAMKQAVVSFESTSLMAEGLFASIRI